MARMTVAQLAEQVAQLTQVIAAQQGGTVEQPAQAAAPAPNVTALPSWQPVRERLFNVQTGERNEHDSRNAAMVGVGATKGGNGRIVFAAESDGSPVPSEKSQYGVRTLASLTPELVEDILDHPDRYRTLVDGAYALSG